MRVAMRNKNVFFFFFGGGAYILFHYNIHTEDHRSRSPGTGGGPGNTNLFRVK